MPSANQPVASRERRQLPAWLGLCLLLAIAGFFLWEEHQAHFFGLLPYALLLLCPAIHLLMHRGHRSQSSNETDANGRSHRAQHGES